MGEEDYKSVFSILDANHAVCGTGFVIKNGLAVTCSHVLKNHFIKPGDCITIVFSDGYKIEAVVDDTTWKLSDAKDLAFLNFLPTFNASIRPIILSSSRGTDGHYFNTYGFPIVEGVEGKGKIGRKHPRLNLIQLFDAKEVTSGFSGAPLIDQATNHVVGIISKILPPDDKSRLTETAFAIPIEELYELCSMYYPDIVLINECPYVGLEQYTKEDAGIFFGRNKIKNEILAKLKAKLQFFLILGPSGSGKSSLIQAGIIPHIEESTVNNERWGYIFFRPGNNPYLEIDANEIDRSDGLVKGIKDKIISESYDHYVLFIDQFEDLFVNCPLQTRQEFINELYQLSCSRLQVTIVLILRDDFFPQFNFYASKLGHLLTDGLINIPRELSENEFTEIIVEPANRVGKKFEDGLVERILNDVIKVDANEERQNPTYDSLGHVTILPLLEFALTRLWHECQNHSLLTHSAYQEIGGITGGLQWWAVKTYNDLNDYDRQITEKILSSLVYIFRNEQSVIYSRRRLSFTEVINETNEPVKAIEIVRYLADKRLLVTFRSEEGEFVELIHDSLIYCWELLQKLIRQNEFFIAWKQELHQRALSWKEDGGTEKLLRGRDLILGEEFIKNKEFYLGDVDKDLINASLNLRDKEESDKARQIQKLRKQNNTIRVIAVIALIAMVIAVFLGRMANNQREEAESQRNVAEEQRNVAEEQRSIAEKQKTTAEEQRNLAISRQLAEQARSISNSNYEMAVLMALQSNNISDTTQSKSVILDILESQPFLSRIKQFHGLVNPRFTLSPDGKMLVITGVIKADDSSDKCDSSKLITVSTEDLEIIDEKFFTNTIVEVNEFSHDGHLLGIIVNDCENGEDYVALIDPVSKNIIKRFDHNASDIIFSSDNKTMITGGFDKNIIVWDVVSGKKLKTLKGNDDYLLSLVISPDGQTIYSGSNNGKIMSWDLKTGSVLGTPIFIKDRSIFLDISSDGKYLAAISSTGTRESSGEVEDYLAIWDLSKNERIYYEEVVPTGRVYFSPLSNMLTFDRSGTIVIFDVESKSTALQLTDSRTKNFLTYSSFSPDGKSLYTISSDGRLIVWKLDQPSKVGRKIGNVGPYPLIAMNPKGSTAVIQGQNNEMLVYDFEAGKTISNIRTQNNGTLRIVFSFDGSHFAAGDFEGNVTIWEAGNLKQPIKKLSVSSNPIVGLSFSPDGKQIVTGGYGDDNIIVWDINTELEVDKYSTEHFFNGTFRNVSYSPDGKSIAISGVSEYDVVIWEIQEHNDLKIRTDDSLKGSVALAFTPDGNSVTVSNYLKGNVTTINTATGQIEMNIFPAPAQNLVTDIDYSNDGSLLALGFCDMGINNLDCAGGRIIVWDIKANEQLAEIKTDSSVASIKFYKYKTLITGHEDGGVRVWDIGIESWRGYGCQLIEQNFSRQDWETYIGSSLPYQRTCASLPSGKGIQITSEEISENKWHLINVFINEQLPDGILFDDQQSQETQLSSNIVAGGWKTSLRGGLPKSLYLDFAAIVQCRENNLSDLLVNDFLGVWAFQNTNKGYWIPSGKALITLLNKEGEVAKQYESGFIIGDGGFDWIMSNDNGEGIAMQNPFDGNTEIQFEINEGVWEKISTDTSKSKITTNFVTHSLYGNEKYPQHLVTFEVTNSGESEANDVQIFAVVRNSRGETVDLLTHKGSIDLEIGEKGYLVINSKSISGRCVGPSDPSGYVLDYWVSYFVDEKQLVTNHGRVQIK